jgi:tRNA dimethylallyltransferase
MKKVWVIGGPTASGKSSHAMTWAQKQSGWIINADSQQLYEGLPILTDQPTLADQQSIPHALYGVLPYDHPRCNAVAWRKRACEYIDQALDGGHAPIVVGGTGLYLKALTEGFSPIPDIPSAESYAIEEQWKDAPLEDLKKKLYEIDAPCVLHLKDRQRMIRALTVFLSTGHPLSYWHNKPPVILDYVFEKIVLLPGADETRNRIQQRFDRMISSSVLEEAAHFMQRPQVRQSPLMHALGLEELAAYMRGEIPLEMCRDLYVQKVHQYAKRQRTWFRHQWGIDVTGLVS